MSAVEQLLQGYIAEHRSSGDTDPARYLDQVSGTDRAELAALIDGYLAAAPSPRAFDAEAFAEFRADPGRQEMVERILDDATLGALRREAQVTKEGVGRALAGALGLSGREQEVKSRYHDLETGAVDPSRVRPGVWSGLAEAFGASVERVRDAAESAFAGRPGGAAGPSFARTAAAEALLEPTTPADADDAVDRAFFVD